MAGPRAEACALCPGLPWCLQPTLVRPRSGAGPRCQEMNISCALLKGLLFEWVKQTQIGKPPKTREQPRVGGVGGTQGSGKRHFLEFTSKEASDPQQFQSCHICTLVGLEGGHPGTQKDRGQWRPDRGLLGCTYTLQHRRVLEDKNPCFPFPSQSCFHFAHFLPIFAHEHAHF